MLVLLQQLGQVLRKILLLLLPILRYCLGLLCGGRLQLLCQLKLLVGKIGQLGDQPGVLALLLDVLQEVVYGADRFVELLLHGTSL